MPPKQGGPGEDGRPCRAVWGGGGEVGLAAPSPGTWLSLPLSKVGSLCKARAASLSFPPPSARLSLTVAGPPRSLPWARPSLPPDQGPASAPFYPPAPLPPPFLPLALQPPSFASLFSPTSFFLLPPFKLLPQPSAKRVGVAGGGDLTDGRELSQGRQGPSRRAEGIRPRAPPASVPESQGEKRRLSSVARGPSQGSARSRFS